MEVAGLVLGAVPLAITALQCYKTGKKLTDRVRNRKKHIDKLIRALQGHDAVLELYLVWLLKAAGSYEAHHTPSDIPELIKEAEVVERIEETLGEKGSAAFLHAVCECQEAVQSIARSIEGFLPQTQDEHNTLAAITQRSAEDVKFKFRKGIKLALGKEEVDDKIARLDIATRTIDRLQNTCTMIHHIDAIAPSKTSKKLEKYLCGVRHCASRLYKTIHRGWIPGCHSAHEAKLFLEDRVEAVKVSKYSTARRRHCVNFNVIFASESTADCDLLWQESEVEVVEDGSGHQHGQVTFKPPQIGSPSVTTRTPKVIFSAPMVESPEQLPMIEMDDICLSIIKAKRENKMLRLYLLTQEKFHCISTAVSMNTSGPAQLTEAINLETLISTSSMTDDRSRKLSLKPRIFLALTLASTLLQLSTTPWLGNSWSKDTIYFLKPMSASQHASKQTPVAPLDLSRIDLTRPLISQKFENKNPLEDPELRSNPRNLILELGIMLLELWNEMTFESYAASTGLVTRLTDYYDRVSLAQRWLEDLEDSFTPAYFDVTARCIRCHFEGISINPTWENVALSKGLVESVIEPLQVLCRPKRN